MKSGRTKVLVAMSGGVDSSVAAAMLARAGHEVVGCFMRLGSPGETLDELHPFDHSAPGACDPSRVRIGHQGCCSISDAADARLVAAQLGIPFYVCNFKKDFSRIIDYFVDEYAAGRTPNPCVRCNDWLKFGKLHEYAAQIGATHVASGHYARIVSDASGHRLARGIDRSKDQSYVLFGAPRERLSSMLLPIGELEKPAVRELARQWGLPVFDKPDSQEICFVPDNDYAGLVERRRPDLARPGRVTDPDGNILGSHGGQHRFTVGQRRGVRIATGKPVFVLHRDSSTNTITVGSRDRLHASECTAHEANWLVDAARLSDWTRATAKYRSGGDGAPAQARTLPDAAGHATPSGRAGRFQVRFTEPQFAVAPGQAIVLYDDDVVLGGGWIESVP